MVSAGLYGFKIIVQNQRINWEEARPKLTPPSVLNHYTRADVVLSWLSHPTAGNPRMPEIWATNVAYMNDSTELLYASDLVQTEVRGSATRADPVGTESVSRSRAPNRCTESWPASPQ